MKKNSTFLRHPAIGICLHYIPEALKFRLAGNTYPARFVITKSDDELYHCELSLLGGMEKLGLEAPDPITRFFRRKTERADDFNALLIVPTGIGAEIGGHAGDAMPVTQLLAETCDTLVTHPNVVNASDIRAPLKIPVPSLDRL